MKRGMKIQIAVLFLLCIAIAIGWGWGAGAVSFLLVGIIVCVGEIFDAHEWEG